MTAWVQAAHKDPLDLLHDRSVAFVAEHRLPAIGSTTSATRLVKATDHPSGRTARLSTSGCVIAVICRGPVVWIRLLT